LGLSVGGAVPTAKAVPRARGEVGAAVVGAGRWGEEDEVDAAGGWKRELLATR